MTKKKTPANFKAIEAEYFDPEVIGKPKYFLYRFDNLHNRFYFEFPANAKKSIPYISVTSLADLVLAKSHFFNKWLNETPDAIGEMRKKAVFGTAFHINAMIPILGRDPVHGKGYDFDWLLAEDEWGQTNFMKLFPPEYRNDCHKWYRSFVKGLLSWFLFLQEKVIKVVAIEMPLRTKKGVAATLDVVCVVMFNGKPVNAIVDIKSLMAVQGEEESDKGDKKYFDSHEFQLEMQKDIWNENYGNVFPVTHVFNWSPKNWKDSPTYTFQNQTNNRFAQESSFLGRRMKSLDFYLQIAKVQRLYSPPSTVASIIGKFSDLKTFDWASHIFEFDVREPRRSKSTTNGTSKRRRSGELPQGA